MDVRGCREEEEHGLLSQVLSNEERYRIQNVKRRITSTFNSSSLALKLGADVEFVVNSSISTITRS